MEYEEFSGASVDDAITAATVKLGVTSDHLEYEIIEKGSSGFLGLGGKDAVIRARVKIENEIISENDKTDMEELSETTNNQQSKVESEDVIADDSSSHSTDTVISSVDNGSKESSSEDHKDRAPVDVDAAKKLVGDFLNDVFGAMQLEVNINYEFDESSNTLSLDLSGPEMGIIIGKRGQTLDSVQYLTNLAVNRKLDSYVRIKIDTEDYRRRRKETLENLAKNVAYKVKRTRKPVSLEAMNPYERRIIHFALQGDNYVTTHSEGEEPYRHVVVTLK